MPLDAPPVGPTLTRRTMLSAGVVMAGTAGVAVLAGCSSKKSAASAAPTPSTAASTAASSTAAAAAVLAKVADIPVGDAVSANLDGKPILISQPAAGTIVAFTAICTHQGCTVAPAGKQFHCPCHGSVYDAATGKVITGPAPAPLAAVAVKVDGANVVAG